MNEGLAHQSLLALAEGPNRLKDFRVMTTRTLAGSSHVMSSWGSWGSESWRIIAVSAKKEEADPAYRYFQFSGGLNREKTVAILKAEVATKLAEELRVFLLIDCVHAL